MLTLGIDCSAKSASVALLQGDEVLGKDFLNNGYTHSQTLLPMVAKILEGASKKVSDLDLIGVTSGPGSFTGVRIGVSLVKGLAFPHNTPCVGVSTLEALAHNIKGFTGIICPLMDARREQVYTAFFESNCGKIVRLCDDRAVSISTVCDDVKNIKKNIIFVGDGAHLCYNILCGNKNVFLAEENAILGDGTSVARVAISHLDTATSPAVLAEKYLRPSQAEREYNNKINEVK